MAFYFQSYMELTHLTRVSQLERVVTVRCFQRTVMSSSPKMNSETSSHVLPFYIVTVSRTYNLIV
jgi:hypothetical protein